MISNKIIACLPLALISTLSVNAHALDTDCRYQQYDGHPSNPSATPMTRSWGTVTTWTPFEEMFYDKMQVSMNFLRFSPFPIVGSGTTKTFHNYESVPQVEVWFIGVNNSNEYWAINPIAIVSLSGENHPEDDIWDHCGPTSEERIIL